MGEMHETWMTARAEYERLETSVTRRQVLALIGEGEAMDSDEIAAIEAHRAELAQRVNTAFPGAMLEVRAQAARAERALAEMERAAVPWHRRLVQRLARQFVNWVWRWT